MKSIRQRLGILIFLTFFNMTVWVLLVIRASLAQSIPSQLLMAGSMMVSILLAALGIREFLRLRTARLITDNEILSISPAIIEVEDSERNNKMTSLKTLEVVISCFGILVGSEIIKFNQDGIVLKAVEITDSTIVLTYGIKQETRRILLLHQSLESAKIAEIVEAFRYETGVVPKIEQTN